MKIQSIRDEYAYKTELHAHTTPVSHCGQKTPAEVVNRYIEVGCNSVVITNHLTECHYFDAPGFSAPTPSAFDYYIESSKAKGCSDSAEFYLSAYYEALEAAKGTELSVILGAEIRFGGTVNDYLVYGICPDDIEKMMTYIPRGIEAFYNEFIKCGRALIMHAHPFRNNMEPTPLGFVDGIEVFNMHPGHNSRVALAARLAKDNGLLICGGSDFHEEGRHATCLMRTRDRLRDSYDVADAIRSQDILFDISGNLIIPYDH